MSRSSLRFIVASLCLLGLSTAAGRNAGTANLNESVLRAATPLSEQRQSEVRTCATLDVPETVADQIELSSSDSSPFEGEDRSGNLLPFRSPSTFM